MTAVHSRLHSCPGGGGIPLLAHSAGDVALMPLTFCLQVLDRSCISPLAGGGKSPGPISSSRAASSSELKVENSLSASPGGSSLARSSIRPSALPVFCLAG